MREMRTKDNKIRREEVREDKRKTEKGDRRRPKYKNREEAR